MAEFDSVWSYKRRNGQLYRFMGLALDHLLAGDPAAAQALLVECLGLSPERLEDLAFRIKETRGGGPHPNGTHPRHTRGLARSKRKGVKPSQRKRIFERDGNRCRDCGCEDTPRNPLSIDHIIPIVLGGTNQDANLQTLCTTCNLRKNKSLAITEKPYDLSRYELRPRRATPGLGDHR